MKAILFVIFVFSVFISACNNYYGEPELDRSKYPGTVEGELNSKWFSGYSSSTKQLKGDNHYIQIAFDSLNDFYARTWTVTFGNLRFNNQKQVIRHIPGEHSPFVLFFTKDYDLFLSEYVIDTSEANWIQFSSVDSIKNELIGKFSLNLVFESGYTHLPESLIFENCTFKSKFLN